MLRIEQQRPAIVALAQLPADPIQAVAPEAGAVDLAVVIGSHSGFSPAPTLGGAIPACHMRNPQGRQASAENEGGATACGIGFCAETKLSGVSHDADKDLSLSFKRVS